MTNTISSPPRDGALDIARAADDLAQSIPNPLAPLARIAYNYRWCWMPRAAAVFRELDPERWELANHNPVRLLHELSAPELEVAADNPDYLKRIDAIASGIDADLARPALACRASATRPVAFLCAEFAVHESLPIYSGGLGALAGDIVKEASDLGLPMVGVGLMYREGYFLQRTDLTGYQHEYWMPVDPDRVPAAIVTGSDGTPLIVNVPVRGRDVAVQIWRVDVGRVPMYLLDAALPANSRLDRWITSRLYVADRTMRLAQYALLGIGSMRALAAMGLEPSIIHLNEGHAGLAPLEWARMAVEAGSDRHNALSEARDRTVFTTHTPVAAGNEGYDAAEIEEVLAGFPETVGFDSDQFLHFGRTHPDNPHEPFVMTPLGIKMSRFANGVSKRHGEVARSMWHTLFPERPTDAVPIGHVTNGVHVPTWMAPEMQDLLARHLGADWMARAGDAQTWAAVDDIPDGELWALRNRLRGRFTGYVRDKTVANRLARGETRAYVEAGDRGFQTDVLTVGFARRLATYKRLSMLTVDSQRVLRLLSSDEQPFQLVVAGKAHPQDEDGKRTPQGLFSYKDVPQAAERVSFIDNYDLAIAAQMVAGCDLWVNLPRPPMEASGTSGMKAALNGGLNLSVLDGWWAEAFDGTNGWGLAGDILPDPDIQDQRDAATFYDCLEHEILPLFYERDADGIPRGWVARMKASLKTNGPRFSATRMVTDYIDRAYALRERVDDRSDGR